MLRRINDNEFTVNMKRGTENLSPGKIRRINDNELTVNLRRGTENLSPGKIPFKNLKMQDIIVSFSAFR